MLVFMFSIIVVGGVRVGGVLIVVGDVGVEVLYFVVLECFSYCSIRCGSTGNVGSK